MAICPQCSIEHGGGEEFCGKCGSFLLTEEELVSGEERAKEMLICPKCQELYERGKYCKKCGSLLIRRTPFQETAIQLPEKKRIRKWSREWIRLFEKKGELELCLSQLEIQRDKISSDVFNPLFLHYQDQLKKLSSLHQGIETEVESIRKKASEEIDSLENELKPIQRRLEEFQSLYHLGVITKAEFFREKNEMREEIKSRERSLQNNRQIITLLPSKMGGSIIPSKLARGLLRPFTFFTASVIIILMGAGGYFLWQRHSQSNRLISRETITSPSTLLPSHGPRAGIEGQEGEKIRFLFEDIRQANLRKDIDLFMSCYSSDFSGREGKRLETLETWKHVNYLALSYDLKNRAISGHTASVRLEWLIRISPKMGGQLQDNRIILDSTLKKEDGRWKIKEIKSVS